MLKKMAVFELNFFHVCHKLFVFVHVFGLQGIVSPKSLTDGTEHKESAAAFRHQLTLRPYRRKGVSGFSIELTATPNATEAIISVE